MLGAIAALAVMTSAATDLATIGSNVGAAHAVAAAPTLAVQSAAADEVSTAVAHLFSQHARDYQALAGQATAFHERFVQHLTVSANAYAGAEATNVASLQPFSAIADSIGGAVGGLQGQVANLFNNVQSQLVNLFNRVHGVLLNLLTTAVVLLIAVLIISFVAAVILKNSFTAAPPE